MLEKETIYQTKGENRRICLEERISRMLIALGITSRLKELRIFINRTANGYKMSGMRYKYY